MEKAERKCKYLDSAQVHDWVTGFGCYPLISEEENCKSGLVEVTDAEVEESVQSVPKLDTLILVKVSREQKHKGGAMGCKKWRRSSSLGYPNVYSIATHTHTHKHFGFSACM